MEEGSVEARRAVSDALARLRRPHEPLELREEDMLDDPLAQFTVWVEAALDSGLAMPNAMTLATADAQGHPSARIVLLKGLHDDGFAFYTNHESRKGRQLDENPHAALVFHWERLERQVRVEGRVERLSRQESQSYFEMRPPASRIAAWASRQSDELKERKELDDRVAEFTRTYGNDVPLPPHWGGYLVVPERIEFWQARPDRLHDRILFTRAGKGWRKSRLYP